MKNNLQLKIGSISEFSSSSGGKNIAQLRKEATAKSKVPPFKLSLYLVLDNNNSIVNSVLYHIGTNINIKWWRKCLIKDLECVSGTTTLYFSNKSSKTVMLRKAVMTSLLDVNSSSFQNKRNAFKKMVSNNKNESVIIELATEMGILVKKAKNIMMKYCS